MSYETVCYNGAFTTETLKFNRVVEKFQNAEYAVLFSLNLLNVTQNLIFTFGMALIIFLSAYQISIGRQTVAMFVTLLSYFSQLQAPLAFFGSFYNQVQNNLVDAERMLALVRRFTMQLLVEKLTTPHSSSTRLVQETLPVQQRYQNARAKSPSQTLLSPTIRAKFR